MVEGSRQGHRGAGGERGHGEGEAADMRAGRSRQHDIGLGQCVALGHAGEHPAERVEGMGHALGRTGAAGGEEDGGGRVRLRRRQDRGRRLGRDQSLEAQIAVTFRAVGDDAERQLGRLARGDIGGAFGMGQNDARPAHLKGMIDLGRRITVVQRRHDQAGLEAGEVMGDQRGAIRHQRRHAVAGLETKREIVAGKPVRALLELGPRPGLLQRHQRRLARAMLQADLQHGRQLDRPVQRRTRMQHGTPRISPSLTGPYHIRPPSLNIGAAEWPQ